MGPLAFGTVKSCGSSVASLMPVTMDEPLLHS